jgi:hypothetical protein
MNDAELARNYILDRLPEEDRDACERRFLFDPEFESILIEQEHALLDDYVNLRLSEEDAAAVLRRVAQEPGQLYRLRFAESLKRAAAASADAANRKPSLFHRWLSLFGRHQAVWLGGAAGVAALALIIAVAVRTRHVRPLPNQTQSAAQIPPAPPRQQPAASTPGSAPKQHPPIRPAPATMATLVLLANQQRGEGEESTVIVPPGVEVIRLQLTTEEGLPAGNYSATVSSANDAKVFAASHLSARTESGRRYIDLRIPAPRLSSGSYSVELVRESDSQPPAGLSYRFTLTAVLFAPAK